MRPDDAYDKLVSLSRERALLHSCIELLGWDELTYMPRGGVEHRGAQTAYLAGKLHDLECHPKVADLIYVVEASSLATEPGTAITANLREWKRIHQRATQVPRALVEELAHVTISAQQRWAEARQDNDFAQFRPWLERIIRLKQNEADHLRGNLTRYDALLDEYEPGLRTTQVAELFNNMRPELGRLRSAIAGSRRKTSAVVLQREFPIDRQRAFNEEVAAEIGFDFEMGRLDVTAHPFFSPIGVGDYRITTRYDQHDLSESFFSVLHETGHALYEMGLDRLYYGTPRGSVSSLGVHESQARLWENFVGRSAPFWVYFYPRAKQVFHESLGTVPLEEFYRACNHVEAGVNRVRADEVTYDLHIMVRFELEAALIAGTLLAADVPDAWNEKYGEYLGVEPARDGDGCLQDGHWSAGQFGYFPTYSLGNLYAAQLMQRIRQDLPELDVEFAAGQFDTLRQWLRQHVHSPGQLYRATELITQATGMSPSHRPLVDYLWSKYQQIYDLA